MRERERGETERERGRERERENKWSIAKCEVFVVVVFLTYFFHVMGLVLRRRNGTEKNTSLSLLLLNVCGHENVPLVTTLHK